MSYERCSIRLKVEESIAECAFRGCVSAVSTCGVISLVYTHTHTRDVCLQLVLVELLV